MKANRILGMLKNAFLIRDSELWMNLYVALVQAWNPCLEKYITKIEKVQKIASNIPKRYEGKA